MKRMKGEPRRKREFRQVEYVISKNLLRFKEPLASPDPYTREMALAELRNELLSGGLSPNELLPDNGEPFTMVEYMMYLIAASDDFGVVTKEKMTMCQAALVDPEGFLEAMKG